MIVKSVTTLTFVSFALSIGTMVASCFGDGAIRCGDEVWLISARESEFEGCRSWSTDLPVQRFSDGHWCDGSLDEMSVSSGDFAATVVFVHGYQTALKDAQIRGLQTYQNLIKQPCNDTGPVRYIIWAWKSEKECRRPVRDFVAKSRRAVLLGQRFVESMNRFADGNIVVVGYSLGAQLVVSGVTGPTQYCGNPIRLAVIAPAGDCDFSRCYQDLYRQRNICQTVVFSNRKDRAIKASNLICRIHDGRDYCRFLDAMKRNQGELGCLRVVDISAESNRKHSVVRYTCLPAIQREVQQMVLDCQSNLKSQSQN